MGSLAEELLQHHDAIVQVWYDRWRASITPHLDVPEDALKDSMAAQLELIGRQLLDLKTAEDPESLWRVTDRLQPEKRVVQAIPIEEVVQEYRAATEVVRDWIRQRGIDVPFLEYSYFHAALFELAAESARRYAKYRAEIVARDRATYLAGVMHQLRTPLSALSTVVEAGERQAPDAAAMARMRRSVRRIQFLVDGVLRLERFGPHEMPILPREVSPARLVDEIAQDYEADAARKKLRFETRIDRSLRLTTDVDLLTDVLGNFIHNAIRYTTDGGVIVEAEPADGSLLFRVRDTGPGIPEPKRASLFRDAQPGSAGGAGIGLRIAQRAAQALGGELGVRSEPGRGSEFWVRVPSSIDARSGGHPEG